MQLQYTPSIIVKCLSTQLEYITPKQNQMFYCTDSSQIYYDLQDNVRQLVTSDIYICAYEQNRLNFLPNNYSTLATEPDAVTYVQKYANFMYCYVVETNSLYKYLYSSKTWTTIYGNYGQLNVANTFLPNGDIVSVFADDVTSNGILNDGSVVIRDSNKMICGIIKSDGYVSYIQSLVGGQINIDPSSVSCGRGCLQLNSDSGAAYLNNDLIVFGNIKTVDSSKWSLQYRLVTENIKLGDGLSEIKQGSLIKAGSTIDDVSYLEDTLVMEDIKTDVEGLIVAGSKIVKDSYINNVPLTPPYIFDVEDFDDASSIRKDLDDHIAENNIKFGDVDSELAKINEKLNTEIKKFPNNEINIKNDTELYINIYDEDYVPFVNIGDCVYLTDFEDTTKLWNINKIVFSIPTIEEGDVIIKSYDNIYVDKNLGALDKLAVIKYCGDDKVKILP